MFTLACEIIGVAYLGKKMSDNQNAHTTNLTCEIKNIACSEIQILHVNLYAHILKTFSTKISFK